MPTRGRVQWANEAVEMFYQQTYSPTELIVVDDPDEPSFPGGLDSGNNVEYYRSGGTIGAKRNFAIERAHGELILHWDSDDIYRPDRIAHQVEMMQIHPEAAIGGYHTMDFIDVERERRFRYHLRPNYAIGVSMIYPQATWQVRRFEDRDSGEDLMFQIERARAVHCEDSGGRIIARAHAGNTSAKRFDSPQWTEVANAD